MRFARMFVIVVATTLTTAGMIGPAGGATPAQRCTRPEPDARVGDAVLRPGLNARPTPQKFTFDAQLARCVPDADTGGAGVLSATIKPPGAQTCALVNRAKTVTGNAKITWKNGKTSSVYVAVALTGAARRANLKGRITSGLFAGRTVSGQLRYAPVASHHGTTVKQACANTVNPDHENRNSIVRMHLYRATPFTIR